MNKSVKSLQIIPKLRLEMVPPGIRKGGRPKQRWMDCVNRDMRAIRTTKYEIHMTELTGGELCLPLCRSNPSIYYAVAALLHTAASSLHRHPCAEGSLQLHWVQTPSRTQYSEIHLENCFQQLSRRTVLPQSRNYPRGLIRALTPV